MTPPVPEWDDVPPAAKPKAGPPPTTMGCLIVILLSGVIVMAALVFGIQTRVGCDLVADMLRRQTGLDLAVGGVSLAWPADLYLTDVQTKPSTTPLGLFKAREVRIGWRWGGDIDLALSGVRLEVMKIADGWVPAPFARLGALADVRDTAALIGDHSPLASLDVRDSVLVWNGPDGDRLMAAEGSGISMRPLILGARRFLVFEVTARRVHRAGGVKGLDVRRLWLSGDMNSYMEVIYSGIWDGDEGAQRDWWSPLPGRKNRGVGHEQ